MLAVAIGALLMGIAVTSFQRRFSAEARRVVNKLNGVIHFLYNRAAMESKTYRLAIDFEKQTYWIEVADSAFVLPSAEEAEGTRDEGRGTRDEGTKDEATKDEETRDDAARSTQDGIRSPTEAIFGPAPDLPRSLAQPVALPKAVVLREVISAGRSKPMTEGFAYIHFFPQGQAEAAIINISDADERQFVALEINPLTGFSKVYHERRERR